MGFYKVVLILLLTMGFKTVLSNGEETNPARKCYQCDSASEPNCITDLTKLEPTSCSNGTASCFASVNKDGKVTRGCEKENGSSCTGGDCESCNSDGCNKNNVCQTCDSSNPNCVKSNSIIATFNKICEHENTKCLINIKSDKTIERRCASDEDIKACTNEATCKKCDTGNCNSGIFPSNRLRCYQCSGEKCTNFQANSDEIKSEPCLLYDEKNKCYMHGENENNIIRGCISDANEKNKCKPNSNNEFDKLCLNCDTDNCNNYSYKRNQKLQCIQCTSTKEDTKCMWGQDEKDAKDCKNQIEYYRKDMCYTQIKDGIVHRGCMYDREADLGDCDSGCTICTEQNGCNNKGEEVFTCVRCRSDNDLNCYDNVDNATSVDNGKCQNPVKFENGICYRGIWNGVVIRGCLVDADERVQATCLYGKDKKKCEHCKGKNCNNMKTSGASSLSALTGLILMLVTFLIHQFKF